VTPFVKFFVCAKGQKSVFVPTQVGSIITEFVSKKRSTIGRKVYKKKVNFEILMPTMALGHLTLFWMAVSKTAQPNHRNQTISRIGANIISRRPSHGYLERRCCPQVETQLLGLLYGGGASFVQKWSMPWMSANI
jgi:hypothetical protein